VPSNTPATITAADTSSTALGRSPRTVAASAMPTTGTSSEYGATTPAGYRRISAVQTPDPTTVASTAT
jgi:hypothetical protein